MTFREFRSAVKRVVDAALSELGLSPAEIEYDVEEPPASELGDLAANVAFKIVKETGKKPGDLASEIAEIARKIKDPMIMGVEPHPSGYVNFWVSIAELAYRTIKASMKPGYGMLDIGGGKKVVVEHTSVNPNKALHVGHARNVVLGDSIARLLRRAGYKVEVLNYIDDTGTQVADVILGFLHLGLPVEPQKNLKYDKYCGDYVYVKVNEEYDRNPKLLEKRRSIIKELESGTGRAAEIARLVVPRVVAAQLETCWRLGARYDLLNWESHIMKAGLWDEAFERLKKAGGVKYVEEGKLAGCWVLTAPGKGEEKVLVRSDGTTVYAAKDIPYAAWKLGLLPDKFNYAVFTKQPDGSELWTTSVEGGADKHPVFGSAEIAVTVIDVRQSRVQELVAYAVQLLGAKNSGKKYMHLGYDVVALSRRTALSLGLEVPENRKFVHMSGRKGSYVNVDDVLDLMAKKAEEEVWKRNPGADPGWVKETAEHIAVGALRYQLLRQDPNKIIVFDLEDSLKIEGDTGPYLQYTYARASRIIEKSGISRPEISRETAGLLSSPEEKDLVKELSKFDLVLEEAVRALSVKKIAVYTYRLADKFNRFYEAHRVLQAERSLMLARLSLVHAFRNTMKELLEILGIKPLERI